MCIDFTILNKACPKDEYALPCTDTLVDATAGSERKPASPLLFRTYCYKRISEGLRNAGCTFNRMIKKVLGDQLGRNISTYVNDVVVWRKKKEDHIQDLRETFANLRRHGLNLNLEKCGFGVRRGKLLGCMILKRESRQIQRRSKPSGG